MPLLYRNNWKLSISNCYGRQPEERLIKYYGQLGFSRLPGEQERFVQRHVKPKYDEGCIFMYQTL